MAICNKCGAGNENNDTGYCKFCLAPLDEEPQVSDNQKSSQGQNSNSDQASTRSQPRTARRHDSNIMLETRKKPAATEESFPTENIQALNDDILEQETRDSDPDFEIKEVNFDSDSVPGLVTPDEQPKGTFSEEKYFKDNQDDEVDFGDDSIDTDPLLGQDEEIRITMEQTENGPEINIADDSDFSTMPEILPQENAVKPIEEQDEFNEDSPLTKKIIINPQLAHPPMPETSRPENDQPEETISQKATHRTGMSGAPMSIEDIDKEPEDFTTNQNGLMDEIQTEKKQPELDKELLERVKQSPSPTFTAGIAYLNGNNVSFTGGFKPKTGQQIIIEDKAFEIREKPESLIKSTFSKIPRVAIFSAIGVIAILVILIAASFIPVDDGQIAGILVDPNTGSAVPKAIVSIKELDKTVETSYAGFFVFENIAPGNYTIEYLEDGIGVVAERMTVLEGKTSTLTLSLPENETPVISSNNRTTRDISVAETPRELKPGFMKLNLSPSKSKVYLDGKYLGQGTQTFRVSAGRHRVTVKHDGYSNKSITVRIPEDQIKPYKIELAKRGKKQKVEEKTEDETAADLEEQGKYSEALKIYKKLVSSNKNNIEAVLGRARCLKAIGQNDNALAGFLDGIKIANDRNDTETLLEALDGVLGINPNYLTARYKRGIIFLSQGQYFRAAQDFNKVVEVDRRHLNGYYKLGEAYYKAGNYSSAIDAYQQLQELNFADAKPYAFIAKSYNKLDDKKNTKKYYDKFKKSADITTQNELRNDPEWQQIKMMFE